MIHIKVQYDAYNRTFKLVDKDLNALFEDYGLYDLGIQFPCGEPEEVDDFTSPVAPNRVYLGQDS